MWRHENCPIFKTPHPLSICVRNSTTPLTFEVQFQTKPLSLNDTLHVKEHNQNKNKTKSRHIQIDYAFYYSI